LGLWSAIGLTFVVLNHDGPVALLALIGVAALFGARASSVTALLFNQRVFRPATKSTARWTTFPPGAPGVLARQVLMWTLNSAVPSSLIVLLIICRWNGWVIETTASVEAPIMVLSLITMLLGLRGIVLVSRSIADPVREVIDAMAEVEQGMIGRHLDAPESSEIGRLKRGFNRMVVGLKERDHLRDLFGRHVGADVVRLAIAGEASLSGEVREVAILFIDIAESTKYAARRPPHEVAAVLNDFFRIVVAAVDEHQGLVNKFQGDAALAVFGAPISVGEPRTTALATARALRANLVELPDVDFGIGISAGLVFAGNIGSENRYEYTVIGDPVNEAARLADDAKKHSSRTLASGAAVISSGSVERMHWEPMGTTLLRGRPDATETWSPR
jgi:class 3 adenylate cyclase